MEKYKIILLAAFIMECANPAYVICPVRFHFQSENLEYGLGNLNIVLSGDNIGKIIIDSNNFFVCQKGNDTCDGRSRYMIMPDYATSVPMTNVYNFSLADNKMSFNFILNKKMDTLLSAVFDFSPPENNIDYLIYIGNRFDEKQNKIKMFFSAVANESRKKRVHVGFQIKDTLLTNDSLFLIWMTR